MKRELITTVTAVAIAMMVGVAIASNPARADPVEEFYRGKTIELFIGYSAGGGYDGYARLLARHMGRHIPGNPTIVAVNMPGAGSLVAANYLFNAAATDGTAFGTFGRGIAMAPLLTGDEGIEFEAAQFNWIGSLNNEVSTCVSWHDSPVKTWEDLQDNQLVLAGSGSRSDDDAFPAVLRNVLGADLQVISGYPGNSERLLAMERGEVDGVCGWSWSSAKSRRPEWIEDRKVNILIQMALEQHPDLPDVPLVMDLAETDEQRQILTLIFARQTMGRPFATSPEVPEERVRALREAFQATVRDPEFLAEASRAKLEINQVSGEVIDALLRTVYRTPDEIVVAARRAIQD